MFFFKKKEKSVDRKTVVNSLLQFLMDKGYSKPYYLEEVKTESDAAKVGLAPVVFIWNEDQKTGAFRLTVNGAAISHLLEGRIPRTHSQFESIRDEVVSTLSSASSNAVISACSQIGALPSELFGRNDESNKTAT